MWTMTFQMKACITASSRCSHIGRTKTWVLSSYLHPSVFFFLELIPSKRFPSYLTLSSLQMFSSRCCPLLHRRRRVSYRSSVRVCTVHKVSVSCFLTASWGTFHISHSLLWSRKLCDCKRMVFSQLSDPVFWGFFVFFSPLLCLSAGALGFSVRGMGNNTPQLNRNLTQGTQLPSHITPTTGVPTMSLHTPPSPSRCVCLWDCWRNLDADEFEDSQWAWN